MRRDLEAAELVAQRLELLEEVLRERLPLLEEVLRERLPLLRQASEIIPKLTEEIRRLEGMLDAEAEIVAAERRRRP